MTTIPQAGAAPQCLPCSDTPSGESGHSGLAHYVGGPFPGQNIYKCAACGDRWIRHYGGPDERFGWTRFVREPHRARAVAARPAA